MREEYNIRDLNPRSNPYVCLSRDEEKMAITVKLQNGVKSYDEILAESSLFSE